MSQKMLIQPAGGRLVIVSHTPHYRSDSGEISGWGPTVREISYLSSLFEAVVHVAPVHDGPPPGTSLPYEASNVRVVGVRESGGERLIGKIGILSRWPAYAQAIRREFRGADLVHIRCPANISLLAVLMLPAFPTHRGRWIKYAGNWRPKSIDPMSYRIQRWLLRQSTLRAQVTVNGEWDGEPPHIHSFLNPCLTDSEIREGAAAARNKSLAAPLRLLFVGGLESAKGPSRALKVYSEVRRRGVDATIDFVGDGPGRDELERIAVESAPANSTAFHGWVPRHALPEIYSRSHILLLPSESEGWPKVVSEAMAYGVVPLASAVGSIPQILSRFHCGKALEMDDVDGWADEVIHLASHPEQWHEESKRGVQAAPCFGYGHYLDRVRDLLQLNHPGEKAAGLAIPQTNRK
jgi:glycosyltransferase involved in cell wall biosynthesis